MDFVHFKVNGSECSVGGEVSSTTTLLEYLRGWLELRGTKYMCLEAGCGACTVSVKKTPGSAPEAVNSCMVPIPLCYGWEITTIEKVGNRLEGYHPLQKTLAETNGSQCGYCSPGFVMAMYSLLKSKKKLTMLEIEQKLTSNICRCTGYRSILQAFKKFASDAPETDVIDIEDATTCKRTNVCLESDIDESVWCFVSKNDFEQNILHINLKDGRQWFRVNSIADIYHILQREGHDYMLVAGNTGKGVIPIVEYPRVLIDVNGLSELKGFLFDQNMVVGAGTTLTELIKIFNDVCDTEYFEYLKIINEHLQLVAHVAVRNVGTIAGNLMLKHKSHNFTSDLFLLFQAVGAQMTLISAPGATKTVTMENFLKENMRGKIILNILLPPLTRANKLVTYKVSARSRNAHAIVNAAFLYKFNNEGNRIVKCRIVFAGLSPNFSRARRTESDITGKILFDNNTLQTALRVLSNELVVTENPPEPSVQYRRHVALGLFYKGLLALCPQNLLNSRYKSGMIKLHQSRPVSSGYQRVTTDPKLWPLTKPIPKVEALLQCAGETKYVDDQPSLPREVFATFVLTTVAKGTIDSIDASEALGIPGVLEFYTAKDIPGVNSFTPPGDPFTITNEVILCNGEVEYYNQPLGIIVAETYDIANRAALVVKVKYSNIKQPIIDVRQSKNIPDKVKLLKSIKATNRGNDVYKIIKGEQTIFGQYHYCLENMSCVSWPTEEGIKVMPSSHNLAAAHLMTKRCLNIDQNRIDMEVRRVGGSFGLKLSRPTIITTACSLVTYKMNRPCRFIMPMKMQSRAIGKRMPSSTNYEVGVNKEGVIQYIDYDLYDDNGYIINELLIQLSIDSYYNCYKRERWNFRCLNTVTDTASNSWFRSPGSLETSIATEMIFERIAYELDMDPLQVRLNNLDKERYIDIIEMINTLKVNSNYSERRSAVDKYNSENRWKKRGLRFVPMKWDSLVPFLLNITLSVYIGDGSVSIIHGGVELGQGINTKATQVCAYFLNIPISKIQIKASNTMDNPNNSCTAGSLTTQNVELGVTRCCKQLLKRLEPIRKEMGNPKWEELIVRAYEKNINLQANSLATFDDVFTNNVFGVTLAEVEVDVLTGETEILRVDILEDCGRSVNPYISIGQIEGAFVQGTGYLTSEELVYNRHTGELLTDRTWNYFVPTTTDIPQDLRVYFRERSYSIDAVLGTKPVAEPPICMTVVVPIAIREAIVSARSEIGLPSNKWFQIDGPYTVERICLACENKLEDFKFH